MMMSVSCYEQWKWDKQINLLSLRKVLDTKLFGRATIQQHWFSDLLIAYVLSRSWLIHGSSKDNFPSNF